MYKAMRYLLILSIAIFIIQVLYAFDAPGFTKDPTGPNNHYGKKNVRVGSRPKKSS